MASPVLYQEIQRTSIKRVTDFLRGLAVAFALCICVNFIKNGSEQGQFAKFLLVGFTISVIGAFFTSYKLITEINSEGISVRFPPFQQGEKFFAWLNIREVYIRQYDPLTEYNGWGNKRGSSGWCFTFAGFAGIQLVLENGERILIGTANPKAVAEMLEQLHRVK